MLPDYGQFLGFYGAEKVTITLMEGVLAPCLIITELVVPLHSFIKGSGFQPYSC